MARIDQLNPPRLRMGSWNVREGVAPGTDGRVTLEAVRAIRRRRLDVLALQEVPFTGAHSPLLDALQRDGCLPWVEGHVLSSAMHGPGQSGVALAARLPLRAVNRVVLPNPQLSSAEMTSYDKGLITAEVVNAGQVAAVGSLHMVPFHRFGREAGEAEFAHIWDQTAKEIIRSMRTFTFVGGDFNTLRRDLLDTPLMPAHATGVDTVLYGERAELVSVEIVETFSDHPLCVMEFVLS